MKLSNSRNEKPRFPVPGRGPIVTGSAVLALSVLAGLLSHPLTAPSIQPTPQTTLPPVSQPAPAPEPAPPEESPDPGCVIKGNISPKTGERIYHLPGQKFYDKTIISPEKGERWFCTEEEARAAGWRKAKR